MKLKTGKTYRFTHARKGVFTARFIDEQPGTDGDKVFWHVAISTGPGSGHERLANAFERDAYGNKVTPKESLKLIRPSLVTEVVEVKNG